jgi:hypothetical protein
MVNIQESLKEAGRVIQVIEHLPSKCEALSSNPIYHQKKKIITKKTNG